MKLKYVGKNLGKVALTVVLPPFGLMSFAKKEYEKIMAFALGTILACVTSLTYSINPKTKFDRPYTYQTKTFSNKTFPIAMPAVFLSPLSVYYTGKNTTVVKSEKYFGIEKEAIKFNGKEYILNFSPDKNFGISTRFDIFNFRNLEKARKRMESEKKELEKLLQEGNLLGARKSASELRKLKTEFYETKNAYKETRKVFEDVVKRMNFEYNEIKKEL